jgi:hypothetical protein
LERGQDVQLHTHLNFYYFAEQQKSQQLAKPRTDDLAALSSPQRGSLLRQACELFHSATGYHPVAYRAGNWHANRDLIADLASEGIRLDSSFNPATRGGGSFDHGGLKPNVLQRLDGLWELPLTVARQRLPEPHLVDGMRPFDLVSLSSWEIRKILNDAHRAGAAHVVAVLHSFSGVKAKDSQYLQMKPDRVVRGRVREFMEFLAANSDRFQVSTCRDLVAELDREKPGGSAPVSDLGFVRPLARKFVQAVNSVYWT